MSDIFPKEKKKIIERINRYERSLKAKKRKFGSFNDGYGKRYLLGPLYLLAGDVDGAIKHYEWFEENFNDDSGEPIQRLCWVLAYFRSGNTKEARKSLMRVMLINLYIIPKIIGIDQKKIKGWYGCNWEWKEYLEEIPQEIWKLWNSEEISWVKDLYFSDLTYKTFISACSMGANHASRPKMSCDIREFAGSLAFRTGVISIEFDTWYPVRIEYNHETNSMRYYIDNNYMGEYVMKTKPEYIKVGLGIWIVGGYSIEFHVDNLLLTSVK